MTASSSSAPHTRQWWATESVRIGTNWRSLISLHTDIVNRLQRESSLWVSS